MLKKRLQANGDRLVGTGTYEHTAPTGRVMFTTAVKLDGKLHLAADASDGAFSALLHQSRVDRQRRGRVRRISWLRCRYYAVRAALRRRYRELVTARFGEGWDD